MPVAPVPPPRPAKHGAKGRCPKNTHFAGAFAGTILKSQHPLRGFGAKKAFGAFVHLFGKELSWVAPAHAKEGNQLSRKPLLPPLRDAVGRYAKPLVLLVLRRLISNCNPFARSCSQRRSSGMSLVKSRHDRSSLGQSSQKIRPNRPGASLTSMKVVRKINCDIWTS